MVSSTNRPTYYLSWICLRGPQKSQPKNHKYSLHVFINSPVVDVPLGKPLTTPSSSHLGILGPAWPKVLWPSDCWVFAICSLKPLTCVFKEFFPMIYIYIYCSIPISVMDLYCGFFQNYWASCSFGWGGGPLLWKDFSQIQFFPGGALSTFIHLSLGKAGPFTLESHIHVKALKCTVSQIMRCLIEPLSKNSTQTILEEVPHEWPRSSIMRLFRWHPIPQKLLGGKTQNLLSTFLWVKLIHLL